MSTSTDPAHPAAAAPTEHVLVVGEALVDVVHRADGSVAEHPGAASRTSRSRSGASVATPGSPRGSGRTRAARRYGRGSTTPP